MLLKSIFPLLVVLSFITISFASNSEVEQLSDTSPVRLTYNARHHPMWNNNKVVARTAPSTCQAPSNVSVATPATAPDAVMTTIQLSWTPANSATPGDIMNIFVDYIGKYPNGMPYPMEGAAQIPITQGSVTFDVPNGSYIVVIMQRMCSDGLFAPVSFKGNLRSGQPNSVTQPITCQKTVTPTDTHISKIDSKTGTVSFEWTTALGIPRDAIVWANLEVTGQGYTYESFLNSNNMTLTGLPTGVVIPFTFRIYNGWLCEQSLNYYSVNVLIPPPN